MTTPSVAAQASSPTFEYLEHDMSLTREFYQMYMTADTVSTFVYGLLLAPLSLIAITEAILKNGIFLMYNTVAFTLNTIIDVVTKVCEFVGSFFDDGTGSTYSSIASIFGGNAQPVRIIATAYDPADLITFKFALKEASSPERPIRVRVENLFYNIWYDRGSDVVCIQESHVPNPRILKLKILDDGQFTSIRLNDVEQDQFPVDFDLCMWPCFDRAFEVSSSYVLENRYGRPHINIRTLRGSLLRMPAYHLEQFVTQLANAQGGVPSIRVRFLENDLRDNVGYDAGGPSNDWFDDVMDGVTQNHEDLRFKEEGPEGLKMPATPTEYQNGPLPMLSNAARRICKGIGQMMLFAYQSDRNLLIGNLFEEALYEAAFCLTSAELALNFSQLSQATLLKMAHAIFRARNTPTHLTIDRLNYMLPQAQRYRIPAEVLAATQAFNIARAENPMIGMTQELQQTWREAHEWAKMSAGWTGFVNPNTGNQEPFDPAKVAHQQLVQEGLATLQRQLTPAEWHAAHEIAQVSNGWQNIQNFDPANVDHQQRVQNGLRTVVWAEVGESLEAIHAIAQGIHLARRRWNVDLSRVAPTDFRDKIQGTLDRQEIVNALVIAGGEDNASEHTLRQVDWIIEWLLDPNTPSAHVAAFLKFATGASALKPPPYNRILVSVQGAMGDPVVPMPKGHSCSQQIDLADHVCAGLDANNQPTRHTYGNATREQFLHTMVGSILHNAGQYSMA